VARRRRGRPVDGWIVVDKPAGPSSAAVVERVRRAFNARKAGHAGTLDPAATGVLAIALGEATKTIPYVADGTKAYRFAVRWGSATATDDADGAVLATSDDRPETEAIRAALPSFRGDIHQVPPRVSAVKVDGERAYAIARAGGALALAPRPLRVESLDLVAVPDRDTAEFEMVCGKGGYVRSIARDLGEALGCLGHVLWLRRLRTGPFDLDHSVGLDRIEAAVGSDGLDGMLGPVAAGLEGLPQIPVDADAAQRLEHGNPVEVQRPAYLRDDAVAWVSHAGAAVAIGVVRGATFHPRRVLTMEGA
jgi:tRNA pseudouridine55 synthase